MIKGNIIKKNDVLGGCGRGGGGGLFFVDSSPAVEGNEILENIASFGGGIAWCNAAPIVKENRIDSNSAYYGGGISCVYDAATIDRNVIAGNYGEYEGGGIHSSGSYAKCMIKNNIVRNNYSSTAGGGIACEVGSKVTIINNLIARNRALGAGGAVGGGMACLIFSDCQLIANTFVGNCADGGGGICVFADATVTISNCILSTNSAPLGKEIWIRDHITWGPATANIDYSLIFGGLGAVHKDQNGILNWGGANIDADPLFADVVGDDLHLTYTSPCRNAGFEHSGLLSIDFEGDSRICSGVPDIGADEFYYHLYHSGDVIPGNSIDLKVVGVPGMPVKLAFGTGIQEPPQPTYFGDLFLTFPLAAKWKMGLIPADGVLKHSATVPLNWSSGEEKYFQALVGAVGNPNTVLTNLFVLEVE